MTQKEKTSGRGAPAERNEEGARKAEAADTTQYTHGGGWIPGMIVVGVVVLAIVAVLLS